MFKMQIHNIGIISISIILTIIFTFPGVTNSFDFNIDVSKPAYHFKDKLDEKVDNFLHDDPMHKLAWEKVMINLFDTAVATVQSSISTSVQQTLRDMTTFINEKYLCDLHQNEISTILYFSNYHFRSSMEEIILWGKDLWDNISPTHKKNACRKFITCQSPQSKELWDYNISTKAVRSCEKEISNIYATLYKNNYANATLTLETQWSELFWNNNLEDSSYDLMSDIQQINKLLFTDSIEPASLVFYTSPRVPIPNLVWKKDTKNTQNTQKNTGQATDNNNAWKNTSWKWTPPRNWFNMFREDTIQKKQEQKQKQEQNNKIKDKQKQQKWNQLPSLSTSQDNKNFDFSLYTNDNSILWNNCETDKDNNNTTNNQQAIPNDRPLSEKIATIVPEYTTFSQQKQEKILKEISDYADKMSKSITQWQCNHNGVCESNEDKKSCSDCIKRSWTSPLTGQNIDLQNTTEIKSCIKACDNYPLYSDKAVCILQCSCWVYESDFWKDIEWLSPIFKVKFCMVPPQPNITPKRVKAYSIETIITRIRDTLRSLKNSGQLNIQTKTKEFIDTSNADLDIWWTAAFTFSLDSKDTTSKISQRTKKELAKASAHSINLWSYGVSPDPQNDLQKNKYLVMANPAEIKAKERGYHSSKEKEHLIDTRMQRKPTNIDQDQLITIKVQELNSIKLQELNSFLDYNLKFWIATKKALGGQFLESINAFLKKEVKK